MLCDGLLFVGVVCYWCDFVELYDDMCSVVYVCFVDGYLVCVLYGVLYYWVVLFDDVIIMCLFVDVVVEVGFVLMLLFDGVCVSCCGGLIYVFNYGSMLYMIDVILLLVFVFGVVQVGLQDVVVYWSCL